MPICLVDDGLDMPSSILIYDSIRAIKHVSNRRPKVGPNLAPKINKTWHIPNESLECQEAGNQNCPNQKYEHFCLQFEIFKMAAIFLETAAILVPEQIGPWSWCLSVGFGGQEFSLGDI